METLHVPDLATAGRPSNFLVSVSRLRSRRARPGMHAGEPGCVGQRADSAGPYRWPVAAAGDTDRVTHVVEQWPLTCPNGHPFSRSNPPSVGWVLMDACSENPGGAGRIGAWCATPRSIGRPAPIPGDGDVQTLVRAKGARAPYWVRVAR